MGRRQGGLVVATGKSPKSSKPTVGAIHELPLPWVSETKSTANQPARSVTSRVAQGWIVGVSRSTLRIECRWMGLIEFGT